MTNFVASPTAMRMVVLQFNFDSIDPS